MVKIDVTAEDIHKGIKGNCYRCPVALALRRTTETLLEVSSYCIRVYSFPIRDIQLPEIAVDFIKRFDRGKLVKPFKFYLNLSYI